MVSVKLRDGTRLLYSDNKERKYSAEVIGGFVLVTNLGQPWELIAYDLVERVYFDHTGGR